ncbi:YqcC family protein [Orbaceae bacterium ac157xtp]
MKEFENELLNHLNAIEQELKRINLWQNQPPKPEAFNSEQPFALDIMQAHEWLQWLFLPRIRAIMDAKGEIPRNFSLHPYFEEALKDEDDIQHLLHLIKQLDELVKI